MSETNKITGSYNPGAIEKKWYDIWEKNGYFSYKHNEGGEPFSIVMPPPNVTGQLHMGHALDETLQDILTRWHRMMGHQTFWLPGTDHAGIATQAKVEEHIKKEENLSKYDLGREKFVERVWDWKDQYHARITKQLRLLGASCDWEKERFTLDEGCSDAVQEIFIRLYEKGLIYRGSYIVNWCPHCHTTISDIEVEHKDKPGHLWYFKYPYADGSGHMTIATTRPETMFGDVAVAVNPEDERYKDQIGKTLILPIMNKEIPIIADDYVDLEYGTGCVKITPAHDPNDFEMGLRHNLPQVNVINKEAKMENVNDKYNGMDRYECRKAVVQEMEDLGLLEKIEDLEHAVGECYRCGSVIEPLISPQWFVKMAPLAKPALEAVKNGDIKFVPKRFEKIYIGWLEGIRDWCISRQLWWGHRIPVWYCEDCGEVICQKGKVETCPKCGSHSVHQDEDVLDTWFSSGLWPFSTLGWPDQEKFEELKKFYPTSVLVTGRDIIFFWVARMIFTALFAMNEKPFDEVFIHGLVLDEKGRKMSKSLGNGIDPLEIIEQYGADPLRFMLITGNTPGNDLRFQKDRLEGSRNFANKIWNASRFVLMNIEDYQQDDSSINLTFADKWILEELRKATAAITENFRKYELGEAARAVYDFAWDSFCDWYIEMVKPRLYGDDANDKHTAQTVLIKVLSSTLQLLHPFMPFLTEELWQALPHEGETIMLSRWPNAKEMVSFENEAKAMETIQAVIRSIRNVRAEMNVPLGKKADAVFIADGENSKYLEQGKLYIQTLASVDNFAIMPTGTLAPEQSATAHIKGIEIFLPLKGLIDIDKEQTRLNKEISNMDKELKRLAGKLNNQGFLAKAPAEVVEKEKAKQKEYTQKKEALLIRLNELNQLK
jgi:valyl-tRNA synthetase